MALWPATAYLGKAHVFVGFGMVINPDALHFAELRAKLFDELFRDVVVQFRKRHFPWRNCADVALINLRENNYEHRVKLGKERGKIFF